jgi:DNA-binding NarL/FixJ family response regulator
MAGHRILIVDNNEQFRTTLAHHLRFEVDLLVVGEVDIGEEAVQLAARLSPDVILLDIELPEKDAPARIKALQLSAPAARIVSLSIVPDRRYQERCRRAGSDTYLPKDCSMAAIIAAIRGADS